jgi:DNA polymerase-3 subunit delta'
LIHIELPWLQKIAADWDARMARQRVPHAVLLLGPAGLGKRSLALWLARRHLGLECPPVPVHSAEIPELPDLRWIRPAEDKKAIGIDSVREVVAELSLTSYSGRGKAAVIEPADAMTVSAANGLLKTLEEPPGNALLILVVDRAGRLPATVISRCQRLEIALPPERDSLAWLDRIRRSDHWVLALRQGGGAPLRALREIERRDEAEALARDFAALAGKGALPVETAARWMRLETDFVLDWLCHQVQFCIRRSFGDSATAGATVADSVVQRMDRRKLFCYLDTVNRIRRQSAGSYNVQLTLESLLIDWADGLHDCHAANDTNTMRLNFAR